MVMNDPFKRNNTNTQGQNIWYFYIGYGTDWNSCYLVFVNGWFYMCLAETNKTRKICFILWWKKKTKVSENEI